MKRLAPILVVACLCAAACSSDDDSTSSPGTTEPTTAPTTGVSTTSTTTLASTLHEGDRYVSLGSSIASGFGISVQSTECGRSSRSYPQLIAAKYKLELTDVSCGAASIPHIVDTPQGTNPPQIGAITEDTKLVTVSVGGNDIGYNGTALACGDPTTVCRAPATLDADLSKARAGLQTMIERIEEAAPSATVVFVTYPREIPEGNCPELSYTDDEAALVRDIGARLERMFVELFRHTHVVLVDPYIEPGDHTGCAPEAERWTAGNKATDGFAYHPTALGHEVMAKMISEALTDGGAAP